MSLRLLLTVTALAAAAMPSTASALVAPGRITVAFTTGHREGVDPFSVAGVAVMPDGRIVTSGIDAGARRLLLTRVLPSGAPDPSFGGDGIVSLDVARDPAMYGPFPGPPVLAPDGSLYVSSQGPANSNAEGQQMVITHVLADGRLDAAFGAGGTTMPGVQVGDMATMPDGHLLVGGHIGSYSTSADAVAVERLMPNGALDPSFGDHGIVRFPADGVSTLAALPGGGAAVLATRQYTSSLIELRSDGSMAPGFNGGTALTLQGFAHGLLTRPDGAVDLLVSDQSRKAATLWRVRPDGTADPAFAGGAVAVPDGALIRGPGDSDLITGIGGFEPPPGQPFTIAMRRILADGGSDPIFGSGAGRSFAMPFGGGYGTVGAIHRLPIVSTLDQAGFRGGAVALRPSGGFVAAGAVGVIQYTGEGEGFTHEEVALAAFGPDLAPDVGFGGPAVVPAVTFSLPRQRARTAGDPHRRFVVGRLTVSAPGLCQVSIRARGTVVAKANVPVFGTAGVTEHIWLTKSGRKLLPRSRRATATARVVCEDLVQSRTTVNAAGLLR